MGAFTAPVPLFVLVVLLSVLGTSAAWWVLAHQLARGRAARSLVAAFGFFQLGLLAAMLAARIAGFELPVWLLGFGLMWTLIALLPAVVVLATTWLSLALRRRRARPDAPEPGRRALLASAIAGPPVLAAVGTAVGMVQIRGFVSREQEVFLPGLPPALHGLRVVHLSDSHVGSFTRGRVVERIAAATNAFEPDLVCFTGDLINHDHDDIPAGCDLLNACRARHGVFAVEGNHDLFGGREAFRGAVRSRGVDLLANEGRSLRIRGLPVDLLGLAWAADRGLGEAFSATVRGFSRRTGALSIALAHHPHAFDVTAAAGVSLTLAGHTHGGQLMAPGGVGFGPVMYRYWSGVYEKPAEGAVCVVNNGCGNWLPLRTFAPAEVVCLVLRPGPPVGIRSAHGPPLD